MFVDIKNGIINVNKSETYKKVYIKLQSEVRQHLQAVETNTTKYAFINIW